MRYLMAYARVHLAMRRLGSRMVATAREFDAALFRFHAAIGRLETELDSLRYTGCPLGEAAQIETVNAAAPVTESGNYFVKNFDGVWRTVGESLPKMLWDYMYFKSTVVYPLEPPDIKAPVRFKHIDPADTVAPVLAEWLRHIRVAEGIRRLHEAKWLNAHRPPRSRFKRREGREHEKKDAGGDQ